MITVPRDALAVHFASGDRLWEYRQGVLRVVRMETVDIRALELRLYDPGYRGSSQVLRET